jgi:hypothetical protein
VIDYSRWARRRRLIASLRLDTKNPRIPDVGRSLDQAELIAEMVEHDKVHELAKSIAKNGLYPNDLPITVREDGQDCVIEGNRRVAALKLLLSPAAAPDETWQRRFRVIAEGLDVSKLARIEVLVAPSRRAADQIVMSRHTVGEIESWNPLMKAKFYQNLVSGGIAVDEIAGRYGVQHSDIEAALRMHTVYSIACSLPLPEQTAAKVRDPRSYPVTTLERLYESADVLRFLGVHFDQGGMLVGQVHRDEFLKAFAKMVAEIGLPPIAWTRS